MFAKPKHGWSELTINNETIGSVSDIDAVVDSTLLAFINYYKSNRASFSVEYDAEGHNIGLVLIGDALYSYDDSKMEILKDNHHILPLRSVYPNSPDMYDSEKIIDGLALECINDFRQNISDWADFSLVTCGEEDSKERVKEESERILNLCNELESLAKRPSFQMEIGNMLFGHSRGKYPIADRDSWQEVFSAFLEKHGFDSYGHHKEEKEHEEDDYYFNNGTFLIRPYYWGYNGKIAIKPNFVYKDFEIRWYKYPFRDSYMNKEISLEQFKNILADCERSMC